MAAKKLLLLIWCLLLGADIAYSQVRDPYFLNTSNGLPSNYAYYALRDRIGYLWIATDHGVVKYNGYDLKFFGKENGIANEDVWFLFEDRKGRIWLSNVGREMGYILNDKYHTAVSSATSQFYPNYITEYNDGIYFTSLIPFCTALCIEKNDTIRSFVVPSHYVTLFEKGALLQKRTLLLKDRQTLLVITIEDGKYRTRTIVDNRITFDHRLFENFLIPMTFISDGRHPMHILNISNAVTAPFYFEKNEKILTAYKSNGIYYLTSNKHLYELSPDVTLKPVKAVDSLLSANILKDDVIRTYVKDSFWGEWVTTSSDGVLFNNFENPLGKASFKSGGLKHVSNTHNASHWWDSKKRQLLIDNENVKAIDLPGVADVYKTIPWNKDSMLVFTSLGIAWVSGDGRVTYIKDAKGNWYVIATDGCIESKNDIYIVSVGQGVKKLNITPSATFTELLDAERYTAVTYDSIRRAVCAYGKGVVYVKIKDKVLKIKLPQRISIDKILFDDVYGNVLVQSSEGLFSLNLSNSRFYKLFPDINSKSSYVFLENGCVVMVGKFGAAYCRIEGFQKFTDPYLIQNFKKIKFNAVNHAYISANGKSILETDKGIVELPVPGDSLFQDLRSPSQQRYKLAVVYNGQIFGWNKTDTLPIKQENPTLQFDLINPNGTGEVNFRYKLKGISPGWSYLANNELILPHLKAGETYTVYLQGSDDILQTKIMQMYLYVVPHWWQTRFGKAGISSGALALLGLLTVAAVQITKRRINQKNLRKNLTLEVRNLNLALELKSIYAQLDPHFIFNTLNTGLYFIKKKKTEEAYEHFVSFSHLLRAFIQSSRNKFISLNEEITNLKNYIALQQSRFDNKFDYVIKAPEKADLANIHVPSLLLQPIVENAINHGLTQKEQGGRLLVEFQVKGNDLVCIIDDNGIGRLKARELKKASKVSTASYGSELIKELITALNKEQKIRIELEYIDKQPPLEGTTVIITIHHLQHAF